MILHTHTVFSLVAAIEDISENYETISEYLFNIFQVFSLLSIILVGATNIIICVLFISKSIRIKKGVGSFTEDYTNQLNSLYNISKMLIRCSFAFQFFAWVLFSKSQTVIISTTKLLFTSSVVCGALFLLFALVAVISKVITDNKIPQNFFKDKMIRLFFYSLLYAVVMFLTA